MSIMIHSKTKGYDGSLHIFQNHRICLFISILPKFNLKKLALGFHLLNILFSLNPILLFFTKITPHCIRFTWCCNCSLTSFKEKGKQISLSLHFQNNWRSLLLLFCCMRKEEERQQSLHNQILQLLLIVNFA